MSPQLCEWKNNHSKDKIYLNPTWKCVYNISPCFKQSSFTLPTWPPSISTICSSPDLKEVHFVTVPIVFRWKWGEEGGGLTFFQPTNLSSLLLLHFFRRRSERCRRNRTSRSTSAFGGSSLTKSELNCGVEVVRAGYFSFKTSLSFGRFEPQLGLSLLSSQILSIKLHPSLVWA